MNGINGIALNLVANRNVFGRALGQNYGLKSHFFDKKEG